MTPTAMTRRILLLALFAAVCAALAPLTRPATGGQASPASMQASGLVGGRAAGSLLVPGGPPAAGSASRQAGRPAERPAGGQGAEPAPPAPRTLILVRHAEKDAAGDARDPGLSAAGRARAAALAALLARSGARRLFASELRRTRETLQPLADALGLEVEPLAEARLAERLAALPPGTVAIVAGHSNTLPRMAARLGVTLRELDHASGEPRLRDEEHGRAFVITLPATGPPALLELAY